MIGCRPILPSKPFNPKTLLKGIERGMQRTADYTRQQFTQTTKTWEEHHPQFSKRIEMTANAIRFEVGTDDLIYFFLNDGTRVRRAALSPNWLSKTSPHWIGSGMGAGWVTSISMRNELQGIQAREWDKEIAKDLVAGHAFANTVEQELRRAVIQTGYNL